MEHRRRHLNQHKVHLSTQTRITMRKRKRNTVRTVVGGREIIAALAFAAVKNVAKYDTRMMAKAIVEEVC